jgi:drug/metabolite transporter (DMT)-like permease
MNNHQDSFKHRLIRFQGKSLDTNIDIKDLSFEAGLLVLLAAQLLSSYMGIYVQNMYAEYGNHWQENLFYTHIFSIPLFLPLQGTLMAQYRSLQGSPPPQLPPQLIPYLPLAAQKLVLKMPTSLLHLFLNSLTQCVCITGVNMLASRSSAVTVTIVLNIRKLVSFMLSVWIFGNHLSNLMIIGAAIVFAAGALYGWESSVRGKKTRPKTVATQNGNAKQKA